MKKGRSKCALNVGRWITYAAAGTATAMVAANDAEASILYSGTLNTPVSGAGSFSSNGFRVPLKTLGAGTHIIGSFTHHDNETARFLPAAANHGRVAGSTVGNYGQAYAFKLATGANIAAQNLIFPINYGGNAMLAFVDWHTANGGFSQFSSPGIGFVGFSFNIGAGVQDGWARVNMQGAPVNRYTLVDYAYGSVGQAITAGQTAVPEPASLGLFALGAAGLLCRDAAARKSQAARLK